MQDGGSQSGKRVSGHKQYQQKPLRPPSPLYNLPDPFPLPTAPSSTMALLAAQCCSNWHATSLLPPLTQ